MRAVVQTGAASESTLIVPIGRAVLRAREARADRATEDAAVAEAVLDARVHSRLVVRAVAGLIDADVGGDGSQSVPRMKGGAPALPFKEDHGFPGGEGPHDSPECIAPPDRPRRDEV